jgi:hypothetical protein
MKFFAKRSVLILMAAAAFAVAAQASDFSISLSPSSGPVTGGPGQAVGWGFTLTDSSPTDFIVLGNSSFVGTPLYGSYTDYIASSSQLYVAGPFPESSNIVSPWNQASQWGTGEFDLYSTDPVGTIFSGVLNIQYDVFSVDPNDPSFVPDVDTVGSGTFSENISVEVTPEPSTWTLMLLPFAGLIFFAARRQGLANQL